MNKFDPTSHNITEENKKDLRMLFPETFTERGVDFDRLKTLLGEMVETGPERYSFTWPGKTEAIRAAQASSMGTLVPDKKASMDWDTTENLYLEGDNLEILKLLQKSYTGKVKMIYIDPPYNTGKDFVYPDKYGEGLKTYLEYTGQIDGEGKKLTTNTETDGRYHSKWLNMMYPRLILARNLLKDDGVIFVSIDEHEVCNLHKIMGEVFGAENFIAELIVLCNPKGRAQDKYFATNHEYVMVFSKSELVKGALSVEKGEDQINEEYTEEDDLGKYRLLELRNTHREFGKHNRKNLYYPFYIDQGSGEVLLDEFDGGVEIYPDWEDGFNGCWTWGKPKAEEEIDFLFGRNVNGRWKVYVKDYANGASRMLKTILSDKKYSTEKGQKAVNELFGSKGKIFQAPKSVDLLSDLIRTSTKEQDIILDFFSGSASTAHAVISLNAEDGGNRTYILTQLQEPTPEDSEARKAGFNNIAEIGRERIKRAAKKIREEQVEKIAARETPLDAGFKVYRLTPSTFNVWDVKGEDDLQQKLVESTSLIKGDAKEEDVLTELILKSGYGLTEKVQDLTVSGKKFHSVAGGKLIVSLDAGLSLEHVRAIAEKKPEQFVAREHGFASNDVLTNTAQIMKDKGIDFRVL